MRLQGVDRGARVERGELLAVDGDDDVARLQAAAAAGVPGTTSPILTPAAGSPQRAMPVKITKASRRFIATPATRMPSLIGRRARENERGSSALSPSSPSSFTKPPIGSQLSVYRVPCRSCSMRAAVS